MVNHAHFQGKTVVEHLKNARAKGVRATAEAHGVETPGHLSAGVDSAKETAILLIGIWVVFPTFITHTTSWLFGAFLVGWIVWKMGRSSLLGWARLERLHRLIEQERWEIQHHRKQEKEELLAMYKQKGLSGKLLSQVVEILMADDNRLLLVMLEEELGLALESYEHPLKQALGAGIGVLVAIAGGALGAYIYGCVGLIISLSLIFSAATLLSSKLEGNDLTKSLVWNLSIGALSVGMIYLLVRWISSQ